MNKISYSKDALLAAGLFLANMCMAEPLNNAEVASHCRDTSEALLRLAHWNKTAPCTESVELSAKFLELAANSVRQDQIPYALMHLNFATRELNGLSNRTQCAYFSIKTKPHLVTLAQLSIDVESLDRYPACKPPIQQ